MILLTQNDLLYVRLKIAPHDVFLMLDASWVILVMRLLSMVHHCHHQNQREPALVTQQIWHHQLAAAPSIGSPLFLFCLFWLMSVFISSPVAFDTLGHVFILPYTCAECCLYLVMPHLWSSHSNYTWFLGGFHQLPDWDSEQLTKIHILIILLYSLKWFWTSLRALRGPTRAGHGSGSFRSKITITVPSCQNLHSRGCFNRLNHCRVFFVNFRISEA